MKYLILTISLLFTTNAFAAFGDTGVLDTFDRTDSTTTIGSDWSALFASGAESGDQGIVSNTLYNPKTVFNNYTGMYWDLAQFGPDCEVFMTLTTVPGNDASDNFTLFVRHDGPSGTDGYNVNIQKNGAGDDVWTIEKNDGTDLGATFTQEVSNGDSVGISAIGDTIKAYYKAGAGSWTELASRTDSTTTVAGYIAFYIPGNNVTGRFNDFGGGTITGTGSGGINRRTAVVG